MIDKPLAAKIQLFWELIALLGEKLKIKCESFKTIRKIKQFSKTPNIRINQLAHFVNVTLLSYS
jgi:hypothetical protein